MCLTVGNVSAHRKARLVPRGDLFIVEKELFDLSEIRHYCVACMLCIEFLNIHDRHQNVYNQGRSLVLKLWGGGGGG